MSTSTGKWSELSAKQGVRQTGNESSITITISTTLGVAEMLYGCWLACPVQRSDRSSRRHNHVGVSPVSCSAASSNPRVWRWDRWPIRPVTPAETGGQVRSDQWAGRRKVSSKDFHRSASLCDLNGSSLQVGQARNGQWAANYTTAVQDDCAAPAVNLSVRWQT